MRPLLLLLLLPAAAFVCTIPTSALAQPQIVQTECVVQEDGFVRVAFTFVNDWPGAMCSLRLLQQQDASGEPVEDPCGIALDQCSAPAHWQVSAPPTGGSIWALTWQTEEEDGIVLSGESLSGFELVLDRHPCCYVVYFFHCGIPEADYWETVCFGCDEVQTNGGTWGRVKAVYR